MTFIAPKMARLGSPVAGGVSRSPRGWERPGVTAARGVHRVPAELQLAPVTQFSCWCARGVHEENCSWPEAPGKEAFVCAGWLAVFRGKTLLTGRFVVSGHVSPCSQYFCPVILDNTCQQQECTNIADALNGLFSPNNWQAALILVNCDTGSSLDSLLLGYRAR